MGGVGGRRKRAREGAGAEAKGREGSVGKGTQEGGRSFDGSCASAGQICQYRKNRVSVCFCQRYLFIFRYSILLPTLLGKMCMPTLNHQTISF